MLWLTLRCVALAVSVSNCMKGVRISAEKIENYDQVVARWLQDECNIHLSAPTLDQAATNPQAAVQQMVPLAVVEAPAMAAAHISGFALLLQLVVQLGMCHFNLVGSSALMAAQFQQETLMFRVLPKGQWVSREDLTLEMPECALQLINSLEYAGSVKAVAKLQELQVSQSMLYN